MLLLLPSFPDVPPLLPSPTGPLSACCGGCSCSLATQLCSFSTHGVQSMRVGGGGGQCGRQAGRQLGGTAVVGAVTLSTWVAGAVTTCAVLCTGGVGWPRVPPRCCAVLRVLRYVMCSAAGAALCAVQYSHRISIYGNPTAHAPCSHPPCGHAPFNHPPCGHAPCGHPPCGHAPCGHLLQPAYCACTLTPLACPRAGGLP